MQCPNCNHQLETVTDKGIEVDQCSKCGGKWLDFKELGEMESAVLPDEEERGTLVWDERPSEKKCPRCGKNMAAFNYRLNDLELDYCEALHGYWLDKGEEERVLDEMRERADNVDRKSKVETEWTKHLTRLRSPSFFRKLIGML
jgi:Zn-finger nucleic acid-binding protein